ncbi:hypothetical protein [Nonomuraea jiangxiensis]|uniref:hypothetical protein n=1 Tax=Nonomuraea jiangxiensis TaxID=633440 RepID=UPI000B85854C|nr:hypothetical protein [Nonomuraea jiangxiensis]
MDVDQPAASAMMGRMREWGRGALAGLAVGAVQAVLWAASTPWDGHSGVRGPFSPAMVPAVFLTGLASAALLRLRHWPLIAFTGAVATLVLGAALWRFVPETTFYGFDRSLLGGVHLSAAVAGFTAAGALTGMRRVWPGVASLGVLAAVCALAAPLEEPVRRWHLARAFDLLGVPLVAPGIAGRRLYAAEPPIVRDTVEPLILLEYRRVGAETVGGSRLGIQVVVRRASAATAAQACATPYNATSWDDDPAAPCAAASRGRWVRHGREGRVAVFTHGGGALIELDSHGASEADLLAAADTVRPISADTLAAQVRPVR